VFAAVVIATLCAPLHQISCDTVPGRLGAAVLRCGGGFDLATVDWIWFAPVALLGSVIALRAGPRLARLIALGVAAQLGVIAMFHMWWGGICFGPRFLAEATWIGIWLAVGSGATWPGRPLRGLGAIAITIGVGQLGLWGWRAEQ
jgi:hypothetical protein